MSLTTIGTSLSSSRDHTVRLVASGKSSLASFLVGGDLEAEGGEGGGDHLLRHLQHV
jgi:hypothetical protein